MKKVLILIISFSLAITACSYDDNISPWKDGKVPFYLTGDFSDEDREVLYEAMETWESAANVRFIEVTADEGAYEIIRINNTKSWASSIGENNTYKYMYFGEDRNKLGHLLHELGHCLGLTHEHQRPDRNKFIKINWEHIQSSFEHNFKIIDNPLISEEDYKYDCNSIMHYNVMGFSNDGEKTIQPKSGGCGEDSNMGQRDYLSYSDIKKIQSIYGRPKNNIK